LERKEGGDFEQDPACTRCDGIADVDIHLLWNRDQKMSRAETIFIDSLAARLAAD
jgi:hypothetical protein